jgi:3D (Asp-Asp-Asp) domain-containing protein
MTTNYKLTRQIEAYEAQKDSLENENAKLKDEIKNNEEEIKSYTGQIEHYKNKLNKIKEQSGKLVYLGSYTITHYCCEQYPHICGEGAGLTASGTKVQAGISIAVDRSKIPFGSKVYIEGYGTRIAQDVGGGVKGNHIDIAVKTHEEAESLGTVTRDVWMII